MVESTRRVVSLFWLLLIPVGGAVGAFFTYRGEPERAIDPSAQSPLTGIVAGSVVGAMLAVAALAIAWRSANRRGKAFALHPDAVLVEAIDADITGAALASIRNGSAPTGHAYTVAFTADGMHVYHGHDLTPVTVIARDDIGAVREDHVQVSSKSRAALVVDVLTEEGIVALPLVIVVSSGLQSPEGLVAKAASAVDAVRRSGGSSTPATARPASGHATPHRHQLVPGVSSARLRSWARVAPYLGGAVVAVVFISRFLSQPGTSSPGTFVALGALVVMSLVVLLLFALANAAEKRERAAGYTLHRLGETSVDQVDPATGYVIRRAGEPQLTREQERVELRRVSSLV